MTSRMLRKHADQYRGKVEDYYQSVWKELNRVMEERGVPWNKLVRELPDVKRFIQAVFNLYGQVQNGGFNQWLSNGYGGREGEFLISMFEGLNLGTEFPILNKIYSQLNELEEKFPEWEIPDDNDSREEKEEEIFEEWFEDEFKGGLRNFNKVLSQYNQIIPGFRFKPFDAQDIWGAVPNGPLQTDNFSLDGKRLDNLGIIKALTEKRNTDLSQDGDIDELEHYDELLEKIEEVSSEWIIEITNEWNSFIGNQDTSGDQFDSILDKMDDQFYEVTEGDAFWREIANATEVLATEADFAPTSSLSRWASSVKAKRNEMNTIPNTKLTPKESSLNKEGNNMAKSTSLRERLAALKAKKATKEQEALQTKQAGIAKEARVKVASAWTIAKTMLPTAPPEIQQKFASALITLDTRILASAVRQTAVNSHWTKIAEEIDEKLPLNKLVEDPSLLTKLQKEVEKELKGEPKNASVEEDKKEDKEKEAAKTADYVAPGDKQAEIDNAEKIRLHPKIEEAEEAVEGLEKQIMDVDGDPLDIDKIFDNKQMDEKVGSLANEETEIVAGEEDFDFDLVSPDKEDSSPFGKGEGEHGPSDTATLEQALGEMDEVEISDAASYFAQSAADEADSIGELFKDATVETEPGEMADFFDNGHDGADTDSESDHDDLIGELIKGIGQEEFSTERDTEPKFEAPKAAAKRKKDKVSRPVRSLGHVTLETTEQSMLAKLVFPDDEL